MTRSPHTMGLEVARPGIGVFHRIFLPVGASHWAMAPWPSAAPPALVPRNAGHGNARDLGAVLNDGALTGEDTAPDEAGRAAVDGAPATAVGDVASANPSRS